MTPEMNNGYAQYKQQSITTMSQGEMLVFLYDEIIKRLVKAKLVHANKEFTAFENEVGRAREIIMYFQQTLDTRYAISADLFRLYEFLTFQMSRVITGRRVELIDEIMPFITELRDTWKEADKLSKMNRK